MTPEQPKPAHPIFTILPLVCTLLSLLLAVGYIYVNPLSPLYDAKGLSSSYNVGGIIGTVLAMPIIALVVSLVISGLIRLFRGPFRKSWSIAYSAAVVLFSLMALFSALVLRFQEHTKQKQQQAKALAEGLHSDLDQLSETLNTNDASKTKIQPIAPPTTEAERARATLQLFFNEAITLRKDYEKGLDDIKFPTLLVVSRLANDSDFKESHAMIQSAREIVKRYRQRNLELFDNVSKKPYFATLPPKELQATLAGMNKERPKSTARINTLWDMEESVIEKLSEMIATLEAAKGKWEVQDDTLVFSDDDILQKYNAALESVQQIYQKQQQMQRESIESAKLKAQKIQH